MEAAGLCVAYGLKTLSVAAIPDLLQVVINVLDCLDCKDLAVGAIGVSIGVFVGSSMPPSTAEVSCQAVPTSLVLPAATQTLQSSCRELICANKVLAKTQLELVGHAFRAWAKLKPPVGSAHGTAGRFLLLSVLGRGRQGEVYRARDMLSGQEVAIKQELVDTDRGEFSLEREAYYLKRFAAVSPPFLEFFEEQTHEALKCSLVMGLCGCVGDELSRRGTLAPASAFLVGRQALLALEHIHSHGVVYRDVKPDNTMFHLGRRMNQIVLTDYGLCTRFFTTEHVQQETIGIYGTDPFLSRDARAGKTHSRRSDLESLGLMIRALMGGTRVLAVTRLIAHRLAFQERPPYRQLEAELDKWGNEIGAQDHCFEWIQESQMPVEELEPLPILEPRRQPDETLLSVTVSSPTRRWYMEEC